MSDDYSYQKHIIYIYLRLLSRESIKYVYTVCTDGVRSLSRKCPIYRKTNIQQIAIIFSLNHLNSYRQVLRSATTMTMLMLWGYKASNVSDLVYSPEILADFDKICGYFSMIYHSGLSNNLKENSNFLTKLLGQFWFRMEHPSKDIYFVSGTDTNYHFHIIIWDVYDVYVVYTVNPTWLLSQKKNVTLRP